MGLGIRSSSYLLWPSKAAKGNSCSARNSPMPRRSYLITVKIDSTHRESQVHQWPDSCIDGAREIHQATAKTRRTEKKTTSQSPQRKTARAKGRVKTPPSWTRTLGARKWAHCQGERTPTCKTRAWKRPRTRSLVEGTLTWSRAGVARGCEGARTHSQRAGSGKWAAWTRSSERKRALR